VPSGFDFPANARDLRIGEYWSGQSLTHAAGNSGSQLFAYDVGVVGCDPSSNAFSGLLPGTNNSHNSDSRIWGKPIYAVADGTVLEAENSVPNNPAPLSWTSNADLQAKLAAQAANFWNKPQFKNPGAGNHFYLQHGDHVVLYAHMQHGSLNPALLNPGTPVKRGQFLGLAGNAGNSTGPHLHFHAIKGTKPETGPLRPFPFRDMWVVESSAIKPPNPTGPWVKAADQGLPVVNALVWPAATKPSWYPPGWGEITRAGIANTAFQAEFDKVTSSGYRMVWVDGFNVGGETYFNMVFRPNDGTEWQAQVGLDAAHYQIEFDKWKAAGYRPLHVETFLNGHNVLYAGIWVKSAGPAWSAYHGRSAADHQNQFNTLTKEGYIPVVVSAVETSGGLLYSALYEKHDVGGFILSGALNFHDYQAQTNANISAGRKPASLNAISNGHNPLMLGLWEEKASANFAARHGQTPAQYQAEYDQFLKEGFLTRALSGCDDGNGNVLYSSIWSK
jgi:murein DD-endopeptidase MepM/ murein hydrolase activator NlpD